MIQPINITNKYIDEKIIFNTFTAEKLTPKYLDEDYKAVIENEMLIKETRGNAGDWPHKEKLSKEENFLDLAWHQREFEYGLSFAFVLRSMQGKYMGCAYLYPLGFRSSPMNLSDYDIDFSFWLIQDFYDKGMYQVVKIDFLSYLEQTGFSKIYYSNAQ